ncbi:HK97 family phage prohead protease [Paenibacillus lautus]|uniref:HK97 family phage prohead protease n=1 Tax=Paenibacillus lautus TaxID=1401 RepID=UPI003D2A4A6F
MTKKTKTMDEIFRKDRDYRFFEIEARSADIEGGGEELYVEGYALTFNEPTVLWEYDGVEYKEQIDARAFAEADMSDVIFNYNHGGKVVARTRNQTLSLTIDNHGLYIRARLDGTDEGRKLYQEIRGGYIDRMSFSWVTASNGSDYDATNHMRTVRKVKKLYDVSAVDIPAYDTTSISARSLVAAEEKIKQAAQAAEKRKRLLLKTFC